MPESFRRSHALRGNAIFRRFGLAEAQTWAVPDREAEPRGLCVPKQSLGTRDISVCLILTFFLAGCQQNAAKPPAAKPAEVIVSPAIVKSVTDYEDFTGTLEAFKKIDITSRVTGYLEKVNFTEGGLVKKDDVLFEIDPRPAQAELDKAEAAVVQAEARAKRLAGDYQRAQDLLRSRSISKEEFEKVAGDMEEAKAAVGVAAAGRASAKLTFAYTKVLAPIDGRAGRTMLNEGNLVKADMTMLTTVVTQNPIHAYFDVDERSTIDKLRRLAKEGALPTSKSDRILVKMALADDQGFPYEGEVDFVDNAIDPATGTQRLRGVFDNKSGLFKPGLFVRIRFQVGVPRQAVVVKELGVGTDQGQKYVYIVDDKNEVIRQEIKKTGSLDDGWRVVEDGVKPGDRIVISGLQRIRPNTKVEPRLEAPSTVKTAREVPVIVPK